MDDTPSRESYGRLAWEAQTLFERVEHVARSERTPTAESETARAEEFLADLTDEVSEYTDDRLAARLEADGLSEADVAAALAPDEWPADRPLPEWTERLDALVTFLDGRDPDPRTDADYPFEHVVAPWVAFGFEQMDASLVGLSDEAVDDLETWLYERLLAISAESLFVYFKMFLSGEPTTESGDGYVAFAERLTTPDGLRSFFAEFPLLGRLVSTTVGQWVGAVESFLARLNDDRGRLREAFCSADELGTVERAEPLTTDTHADGRTVFRVAFESGDTVAYKPRSVGPEGAFNDLLEWLNERDAVALDLRTVRCLSRSGYGWMEWVEREDCPSGAAVSRYYRRAGALLCVSHLLGLTDAHFENVVPAGEHPVLVDAETVMHPSLDGAKLTEDSLLHDESQDSVLRTGLLPWKTDESREENVSGLAAAGVTEPKERSHPDRWPEMNTGAMEYEQDVADGPELHNRPTVDGEPRDPVRYLDDVVAGFRETYRSILAVRDELLDGPLADWADLRTRFLYMPSEFYNSIRRAVASPRSLSDGLQATGKLENVAGTRYGAEVTDRTLSALDEWERRALKRGDVPRLGTRPASERVAFDGERSDPVIDVPGYEVVRRRLARMGPGDLAKSVAYVRFALGDPEDTRLPALPGRSNPDAERGASVPRGDHTPRTDQSGPPRDQWIDAIARYLEDSSHSRDDGPTWLVRTKVPDDAQMQLQSVGEDLYAGRAGIALLFAALAAVRGDETYRDWAFRTLEPLRPGAGGPGDSFDGLDPHGIVGVASVVYALRTAGVLLNDDELVSDALAVSDRLADHDLADCSTFDALAGTAGTTLSLSALYESTGRDDVLETLRACGDHLLENRRRYDSFSVWPTEHAEDPLVGYSHGVSGIAYALYRLSGVTGDDQYRSAADEALEYERERYDPTERNWPDLRDDHADDWMDAWCHGRTGVGLARLGMLEVTESDELRRDLRHALDGADPSHLSDSDHLCCGNAGRIEFLLQAGLSLGDAAYADRANELADLMLERATRPGGFAFKSPRSSFWNPTLYRGVAGIGYTLLRLDHGEALPNLLLFE